MKFFLQSGATILAAVVCLFLYTWYRLHLKVRQRAAAASGVLPIEQRILTQFAVNQDNQRIAYWYVPAPRAKAVVMLIHGYSNPGGKAQMVGHAEYLMRAGYSVVLLDLRSYGESEGNRMTLGVNEWKDVAAVYNVVRDLPENQGKKIGYLGISMGAATALVTAGQTGKGDFVIASVPYASFSTLFPFQIASEGYPPLLITPLMKLAAILELGSQYEHFTPRAQIGNVRVPTFFISALQDKVVPKTDAKLLFDHASQPKMYWEADAPHDVFHALPQEFSQKVLEFLEQVVQEKSESL